MKQTTKNVKHKDVGEKHITNEIKKNAEKPEWIIIGGVKHWKRKCNHCGNVVLHLDINRFYVSRKHNHKCQKCRQPKGKKNSFYGKKHTSKTRKLYSRQRLGKNNPMYGTNGGFYGHKHNDKSIRRQQILRKKYWKSIGHECSDKFVKYRTEVDRLTNRQPINTLKNVDKRGKAGINGAYHLDHIKSVWYGFKNKIPAKEIADIKNLRFIPWLDNQKKWYK